MGNSMTRETTIDGADRAEAVAAAVASARIEGFVIGERAKAVLDDYASGSIGDHEMVRRVLALHGVSA